MPKNQNVFTKELKLEAVQLVQKSGKPHAHIARDPGIAESTLHHWCKECAKAGAQAFPGSGNPPASEEEVRRLRRENEVLRQERDILQKALALFSRNPV
jgi:transposase